MRSQSIDFQETAIEQLHCAINAAHAEGGAQIISFSAPTGSGKTVMMATLFEEILCGTGHDDPEQDAIFVWLSDMPELNAQTRLKIESMSDKIFVRNLITIDSTFVAETLTGGCVYFLNTQKLGSDKLLTQKSDDRQYTIWETLANTARKYPKKLYVIIDEAHRGTNVSDREAKKAQSIMQKFIIGSPDDGLCAMPLVIGVTATPQRFQNLILGVSSTVRNVVVKPEDVRDSGLLKDRVLLEYPETVSIAPEITMFASAVDNWKRMTMLWAEYCESQSERPVKPILVIQVENRSDADATKTDLAECIKVLKEKLGRSLQPGEIVHTFDEKSTLTIGDTEIQSIEASRIEETERVSVVVFKESLSTGWDCPRAETMMSFRTKNDPTSIAQLLGRMVRTPLKRRITSNAELNNVTLFLPYYDTETVKSVVEALQNSDAVSPDAGSSRSHATLFRNDAFTDVFSAMDKLSTYRVDAARKIPALRRLVMIARYLTMDGIDATIQKSVKEAIIHKFEEEIKRIRESGEFDAKADSITDLKLSALTIDYGTDAYTVDEARRIVDMFSFDIDAYFSKAGKLLGEGLHIDYWTEHGDRDYLDVKIEIIVMVGDETAMSRIDTFAQTMFEDLFNRYQGRIYDLNESRINYYEKLSAASDRPIPLPWKLPDSIEVSATEDCKVYDKHLYVGGDDICKLTLGTWEEGVLEEELRHGAVCWLRNLDRKPWSLGIPYKANGVTTPMYPDLIIVTTDDRGYVFDILEPHDDSRDDNCDKARGLADFAETPQGQKFGRIQLIRKKKSLTGKDRFYRLDFKNLAVRNKVRGIHTNTELDRIFDELAKPL
jgi:type III restriction enzyme